MTQIMGDGSIEPRLAFIGLEADESQILQPIRETVERHLDGALDEFYATIGREPEASRYFGGGSEQLARARGRQVEHWQSMADGRLDADYYARSRKIGQVHARIGLDPRWYMGGYAVTAEALVNKVLDDMSVKKGWRGSRSGPTQPEQNRALARLVKIIILDMEIGVSTYFDQLQSEAALLNRLLTGVVRQATDGDFAGRVEAQFSNGDLNALAEQVNSLLTVMGEQIAGSGVVLSALARADLTQRAGGNAGGAFASLREDINSVCGKLNDIVGRIMAASQSLKHTTRDMVGGADDLSDRTNRQAAAIEEIAATMEQTLDTLRQNAELAAQTEASVHNVSSEVDQAGVVMSDATAAMEDIRESSNQIAAIIGLIDTISFQTNLLALNASVEAARAGDAGKGFAVVAVEVRRLAQSAAEASAQIKELVEKCLSMVERGSNLVGAAAGHLGAVTEAAKGSTDRAEAITAATQRLLSSMVEVNQAVRQIDEMTQHNASLIEETNLAVAQTEAQAGELDDIVETFVVEGGRIPRLSAA
jgi:methyl-accepting chemotaxis protein